ncbi:MAG: hypothetical protein ABIQ39_03035 [Ilumatobacteraceae bacterium]
MIRPSVSPMFVALVDDAGLFPPAELSIPLAVERHRHDSEVGHPVLSGRFLCPTERLDDLIGELTPGDRFPIGLISRLEHESLAAAVDRITSDPRVTLAAVEGRPGGNLDALAEVPPGVPTYVELPVTGDVIEMVTAVGARGYAVKVRCGGIRADLFPTVEQLGGFIYACALRRVPFKATAGLHHALPYRDPQTGFTHHGFLNLLLAACRAVDGATTADLEAVLNETTVDTLVTEAHAITPELATAARSLFIAYGSCSTREPIDDLSELGLLNPTKERT